MRLVLVVAIAAAGVSGGCASQMCPAGLLEGVLTEQDGELVVMPAVGRPSRVIWPDGHAVRQDGDQLIVLNIFGSVVAREGDTVRLGGGYISAQPDAFTVCGSFEVIR